METPLILGIVGHASSGKDTAGSFLASLRKDAMTVALADPIKMALKEWLGFTHEQLYGSSELREAPHPDYGVSARVLLQTLGTEWGRAQVPDIWVDFMLRRIRQIRRVRPGEKFIVTDVRFENEMRKIRDNDGYILRIVRHGCEGKTGVEGHASETEMDKVDSSLFDHTILVAPTVAKYQEQLLEFAQYIHWV